MKALEGKVAVVTGSGQGIGRGIAIGLAREGAKVITNNRKAKGFSAAQYRKEDMPEEDWEEFCRLKGDAEMTAAMIREEGNEASWFYGDVSDFETAEKLVKFAVETYGRIDIIVNNAAGMGTGSIKDCTEKDWDYIYVPRNKAAFNLMHFAAPYMMEQKYGRILNIASDAWTGLAGNDAYSASTAGIVGLTWAAAKELAPFNITVNAFCPQGASPSHAVEYNKLIREITAAGHAPDPNVLKAVEADHGDPVNLGPICALIASEDGGYISGSVFAITSAGRVSYYSNPAIVSRIFNNGEPWTVEELKDAVKNDLLPADYKANTGMGW